MMSVIAVESVNKRFKVPHEKRTTVFEHVVALVRRRLGYEEFLALEGVSFEVEPGETFGIIGENGSGKTTLLRILAGIMRPDTGSVTVNGRLACIVELGTGFQPELTAKENVAIYAAIMGMTGGELKERYNTIIDFAELRHFEDMKLKNFSSGMTIRLAFSTAVHTDPDIILLDEVLAVGDEAFQKKCMDRIYALKAQGKTTVFVSHALPAVGALCERAMALNEGRVLSIGDTDKVIADYLDHVSQREGTLSNA